MKKPVFTGAAVAIITPMRADGSVDYEELGRIIDDQIDNGTDAIVICGTTGESPTMTDEEHTACIRYAVKKTAGRVPVIAGTGSNDTKYAIWLSRQAQADGADALLLVTPYYNKTSQAGLIAHYTAIADAVDLPCILYNVPSRTGCNLTAASLKQLAALPLCKALFADVNPIPVKWAMNRLGWHAGACRLPLVAPDEAVQAQLDSALRAFGLLS